MFFPSMIACGRFREPLLRAVELGVSTLRDRRDVGHAEAREGTAIFVDRTFFVARQRTLRALEAEVVHADAGGQGSATDVRI